MNWRYVVIAFGAMTLGCAAPGRDQSGLKIAAEAQMAQVKADLKAEVNAEASAALAEVELRIHDLQARFDTRIGEVDARITAQVGGGGDSVTAWLYAAIAGAAVLYPLAIRPMRRVLERRSRRAAKRARQRNRKDVP